MSCWFGNSSTVTKSSPTRTGCVRAPKWDNEFAEILKGSCVMSETLSDEYRGFSTMVKSFPRLDLDPTGNSLLLIPGNTCFVLSAKKFSDFWQIPQIFKLCSYQNSQRKISRNLSSLLHQNIWSDNFSDFLKKLVGSVVNLELGLYNYKSNLWLLMLMQRKNV